MKTQYPNISRHEMARKIKVMRKGNYRSHKIETYVGRFDDPEKPEYILRSPDGYVLQPDAFRGQYTQKDAEKIRLVLALRNEKIALQCMKQGHQPVCI